MEYANVQYEPNEPSSALAQDAAAQVRVQDGRLLAERAIDCDEAPKAKKGRGRPARSVTVNLAESPLGWLFARGLVNAAQFDAGERLRSDWERAQLPPRVTMSWDAAPVAWWTWLARTVPDEAEAGGGLMVAIVQLAITLGATVGGVVFDAAGPRTEFLASAGLLILATIAAFAIGRYRPSPVTA